MVEGTFTSSNSKTLPLPNLDYLTFYAAVAKIVHTAGMADDKLQKVRVLSDKSGAKYLHGLLCIAQYQGFHRITLSCDSIRASAEAHRLVK